MHLLLMRHGIAVDRDEPKCPADEYRPLTSKGIQRTRAALRGLATLGARPRAFWSSPYVRALQTAAIAAEVFRIRSGDIYRTHALEPNADPEALLEELASAEVDSILCCGHAPNLDEVVACALGTKTARTQLRKAGVACLELDRPEPGGGQLLWLMPPKALRRLAKR